MTKKELLFLLIPSLMFLVIGAWALHYASALYDLSQFHSDGLSERAYDNLVKKVQSGELQVTPEMMIDQWRRSQQRQKQ